MWSSLKKLGGFVATAATAVWDYAIKPVIFPSIISTGRIISSVGSALFMLPKFNKWLTGEDKESPWITYLSYGVVVGSVIVQLATRVPSIFRQFNPLPVPEKKDIELLTAEERVVKTEQPLGYISSSVYYLLYGLTLLSAAMTLPNNYQGAKVVYDFGAKHVDADPTTKEYERWLVVFSSLIALTSFANYLIFTVKKGRENAYKVACEINKGNIPFNTATFVTIAATIPGAFTIPCTSWFSTRSAFNTVLYKATFKGKEQIIDISAYFSSVTALVSQLTTQPPAVYQFITNFNNKKSKDQDSADPCWLKPVSAVVYSSGLLVDGFAWGIANFTGVATTYEDKLGGDSKNTTFIVVNAACAVSASGLYFCFSVIGGFNSTKADWLKNNKENKQDTVRLLSDTDDSDDHDIEKSTPTAKRLATTSEGESEKMLPIPSHDLKPSASMGNQPILFTEFKVREEYPVNREFYSQEKVDLLFTRSRSDSNTRRDSFDDLLRATQSEHHLAADALIEGYKGLILAP